MKRKALALAAVLLMAPALAFAADCCANCACCKDKAAAADHQH